MYGYQTYRNECGYPQERGSRYRGSPTTPHPDGFREIKAEHRAEFNRFLSSVGKFTMEKIQLLAKKFNYVPVQDLCIPKNYPLADQFSFTTVECSQVKDIVNSIPNKTAPGIYN